ncbi:MAG: hypothetical protein AAFX99_00430 [Myxococcota bacterium]
MDLKTAQGQREAIHHVLGHDDGTSEVVHAVLHEAGGLVEDGAVALVLAAAAVTNDREKALKALEMLERSEVDEQVLERWNDDALLRQAAYAVTLRRGWQLRGAVRDLLLGELEVVDQEDPEQLANLQTALGLLARVAPEAALEAAGVCSEAATRALAALEPKPREAVLTAYARQVGDALQRRGNLPDPRDTHALMCLDLLDSVVGPQLLELLSGAMRMTAPAAAAKLARACAGAGLEAALADAELAQTDAPPEGLEPLDAEILRGLLDTHQLSYQDLTGDSWHVRFTHKGEFGQRVHSQLWVGLSARRVTFRLVEPMATPNDEPDWWPELLHRNHYSGSARFSIDTQGRLCLSAIATREGFTAAVFDQLLDDLRGALERLVCVVNEG